MLNTCGNQTTNLIGINKIFAFQSSYYSIKLISLPMKGGKHHTPFPSFEYLFKRVWISYYQEKKTQENSLSLL